MDPVEGLRRTIRRSAAGIVAAVGVVGWTLAEPGGAVPAGTVAVLGTAFLAGDVLSGFVGGRTADAESEDDDEEETGPAPPPSSLE